MDFIDKVKQSWDTLVKPYQITTNHSPRYQTRPDQKTLAVRPSYSIEAPPNLQNIIEEIGPLPAYSIIIGGCEDHSHLFMDLTDPAPGSILIAGDDYSGRSRLLDSILFSAILLNSPRRVRYALISPDLTGIEYLTQRPHCYKAQAIDSQGAIDLIYELAETADFRRSHPQAGCAIILAIDNLASLLSSMDAEMVEQLRWLVQVGPEVQIWTIATINTEDVESIDPDFINHFGTRLIGSVESQQVVDFLNGAVESKPVEVIPGAQFSVFFDEDWIKFWIPAVEEVVS